MNVPGTSQMRCPIRLLPLFCCDAQSSVAVDPSNAVPTRAIPVPNVRSSEHASWCQSELHVGSIAAQDGVPRVEHEFNVATFYAGSLPDSLCCVLRVPYSDSLHIGCDMVVTRVTT